MIFVINDTRVARASRSGSNPFAKGAIVEPLTPEDLLMRQKPVTVSAITSAQEPIGKKAGDRISEIKASAPS